MRYSAPAATLAASLDGDHPVVIGASYSARIGRALANKQSKEEFTLQSLQSTDWRRFSEKPGSLVQLGLLSFRPCQKYKLVLEELSAMAPPSWRLGYCELTAVRAKEARESGLVCDFPTVFVRDHDNSLHTITGFPKGGVVEARRLVLTAMGLASWAEAGK